MSTKEIIIATFAADRAYFTQSINDLRGPCCKFDAATFLKMVMTDLVSENGIALFEKEVDGYTPEAALPCVIEEIARKISTANISGGKMGDYLDQEREKRRELWNIMR